MKVCITEKPSVARDIARILGATARHDGYLEGNGYQVTWTFGHLCSLKDPADYHPHWKRWSIGSLPMIPERFAIKLIDNESYKKQFEVIRTLVGKADEVINCGDAGQEGELIQRWVIQKAEVKCPVSRLWISSLTDDAIREGFKNLQPSSNYQNLYYAGLSRAIGDWLLGLNATRLFSLRYSPPGTILSIGRVQTPTLAMIVERHNQIDNFKSEDYWLIRINYRDVWFNATPQKKYSNIQEAESIFRSLEDRLFIIDSVENKNGKESSPRLFDLTSLQVEANAKWGWSAEQTLRHIQSLYEKKLTTYPRVDTTYLSEDVYTKIPAILAKMKPYEKWTSSILSRKLPKSKRVFDNSKVTDHHAIIPTGESPTRLSDPEERKLYHLIALRFLANFMPDCKFSSTTVTGHIDALKFKATGKTIIDLGWREIYQNQNETASSSDDTQILPDFKTGETGPYKLDMQKKSTQPPKPFTEGTLLKAMETAGKDVESEELREALKENGIGRPSTRASIIETLLKRGYIARKRKQLVPTEAGKTLIRLIGYDLLKSAELTGHWERRLREIEAGLYSPAEFINRLKDQLQEIIANVLSDNTVEKIKISNS